MASMIGPFGNSEEGKSCAVLGCREIATMQCPQCQNHYCYIHSKDHFHKMTKKERDEWKKEQESLR